MSLVFQCSLDSWIRGSLSLQDDWGNEPHHEALLAKIDAVREAVDSLNTKRLRTTIEWLSRHREAQTLEDDPLTVLRELQDRQVIMMQMIEELRGGDGASRVPVAVALDPSLASGGPSSASGIGIGASPGASTVAGDGGDAAPEGNFEGNHPAAAADDSARSGRGVKRPAP